MDFKMSRINNHNNVAQKLKYTTDIHGNKIELEKKHLNKQMVQSLKGLKNVYVLNMSSHALITAGE